MNVADVMETEPVTVQPHTPVEDVIRLMRDHEQHGIPVVNDSGRCVGFITESDLVIADEERDLHLPHVISLFGGVVFLESLGHFEERLRKAAAAKARDLMSEDPVSIEATADVRAAARLIADSGYDRLPVLDDGKLVGVVTRADVLQALSRE